MPKLVKYGKIQYQISGQWFELGCSYFEVKISSRKASIGDCSGVSILLTNVQATHSVTSRPLLVHTTDLHGNLPTMKANHNHPGVKHHPGQSPVEY